MTSALPTLADVAPRMSEAVNSLTYRKAKVKHMTDYMKKAHKVASQFMIDRARRSRIWTYKR